MRRLGGRAIERLRCVLQAGTRIVDRLVHAASRARERGVGSVDNVVARNARIGEPRDVGDENAEALVGERVTKEPKK